MGSVEVNGDGCLDLRAGLLFVHVHAIDGRVPVVTVLMNENFDIAVFGLNRGKWAMSSLTFICSSYGLLAPALMADWTAS